MARQQQQQRQWGAGAIGPDTPADFVAEILAGCDEDEGPREPETEFKSKNLETERRRRAKLKHHLFTLRSLVPRITKMSKEATLADAIDYIQELQGQKEQLEKELQEMAADENAEKQGSASPEPVHCKEEVEVSPLGKNRLRASVVCRNKRGGFTKLVEAMGGLGMEVTGANFLTLDGVSRVLLCMEMRSDRVVAADKVRDLLLRMI